MRERRFKTMRTISALILREIATTYGRSPGGYIWAFLEPIGGIAVFTLILEFSSFIRSPPLGDNFPLFFGTGLMTFLMYQRCQSNVSQAILYSRPLLYYPAVTYMDAILARLILSAATQLLISVVVCAAILVVYQPSMVQIDVLTVATGMMMMAALGFGIGSLNSLLFPMFPLWRSAWAVVTFPLMLVSSVLYIYEILPEEGRQILWFNPIVHGLGMVRRGIYSGYDADWVSPAYVFGLSMALSALAHVLLGRYYRRIISGEFS